MLSRKAAQQRRLRGRALLAVAIVASLPALLFGGLIVYDWARLLR